MRLIAGDLYVTWWERATLDQYVDTNQDWEAVCFNLVCIIENCDVHPSDRDILLNFCKVKFKRMVVG